MRIAIAGGGPAGLYFALLIKKLEPAHELVVYERKAPDDTFGFGVVFSDETLDAIEAADPAAFAEIARRFARWAEIDVHHRGETITSGGHGFSALSRQVLLNILQARAIDVGVDVRFRTEAPGAVGGVRGSVPGGAPGPVRSPPARGGRGPKNPPPAPPTSALPACRRRL